MYKRYEELEMRIQLADMDRSHVPKSQDLTDFITFLDDS